MQRTFIITWTCVVKSSIPGGARSASTFNSFKVGTKLVGGAQCWSSCRCRKVGKEVTGQTYIRTCRHAFNNTRDVFQCLLSLPRDFTILCSKVSKTYCFNMMSLNAHLKNMWTSIHYNVPQEVQLLGSLIFTLLSTFFFGNWEYVG